MTTNTDDNHAQYKDAVFEALAQFQLVESLLRDLILIQRSIIRKKLSPDLDIQFPNDDIYRMPLRALAKKYRQACIDEKRFDIEWVTTLAKKRNDIAHEACAELYRISFQDVDYGQLATRADDIYAIADEAGRFIDCLIEEFKDLDQIKRRVDTSHILRTGDEDQN